MAFVNHYEVLGLKNFAPGEDVRKGYRRLARKMHPDVVGGNIIEDNKRTGRNFSEEDKRTVKAAEDEFKKINESYGIVGSAEEKTRYDAALRVQLRIVSPPADMWSSSRREAGFRTASGGSPFQGLIDEAVKSAAGRSRYVSNDDVAREKREQAKHDNYIEDVWRRQKAREEKARAAGQKVP